MTGEVFGFLGRKVAARYLGHLSVDGFEVVLGFLFVYWAVGGALL